MFSSECIGQESEDIIADGRRETLTVLDNTSSKVKPWNFFDGGFSAIRIGAASISLVGFRKKLRQKADGFCKGGYRIKV